MGLQGWRARPRAPGGSLGPSVRGISGASLNGSSDPQGSLPLTTTKQTHLSWHPNGFPSPSSPSIIQSLSQPPSLHHPHSLLPGHPQGSSPMFPRGSYLHPWRCAKVLSSTRTNTFCLSWHFAYKPVSPVTAAWPGHRLFRLEVSTFKM